MAAGASSSAHFHRQEAGSGAGSAGGSAERRVLLDSARDAVRRGVVEVEQDQPCEELLPADLLRAVRMPVLSDQHARRALEVGRWGEELVFLHLSRKYQSNPSYQVTWVNEHGETGRPYDVLVSRPQPLGDLYIEAKTTLDGRKRLFEVSLPELLFAIEQKAHFEVFRVVAPGKEDPRTHVVVLRHVARRLRAKELGLFLSC
jgi:hypothetical protein